MEIELGRGKRARRAYTFDDIAVVPSRRTRNPEDVSTAWSIDAFQFDIPVLGAPMDSVVSPQTAIMLGELGGLGQEVLLPAAGRHHLVAGLEGGVLRGHHLAHGTAL
ncbi:MAG TPA: IMP dehydrogenase, partial [Microbacteriaceae bacterium]|nr:IMP dehydrogenase [Microbacteriaceae bacterium]